MKKPNEFEMQILRTLYEYGNLNTYQLIQKLGNHTIGEVEAALKVAETEGWIKR